MLFLIRWQCSFCAFWRANYSISAHRSFRYGNYMLINFGRLRLVFVCDLKYPRVIVSNMLFWKHRPLYLNVLYIIVHGEVVLILSFHRWIFRYLRFPFTYTCLPTNKKYKHAYSKTQSLRNRQFSNVMLM
jgi:hypothetical protein